MTVVTVKFYRDKAPVIICTGVPIGVGKFERQLTNIYRAIGKSKATAGRMQQAWREGKNAD